MNTFSQDQALPPLPVPDLPASCASVAELAAPLVDAAMLDSLSADLEDFSRPGGAGEKLQGLLSERALSLPGNQSWLRPFWDDMYLSWREPLPINMNYFFLLDSRRWGGAKALPRLVSALSRVFSRLSRQELEPERARAGFLAMEQVGRCLYSRIACGGRDVLSMINPALEPSISVLCRGHCFLLDLPANGEADEAALERDFAAIRKEASLLPPPLPVCALSSAPREEAALLRAALLGVAQNRLSMAALEKTLFTVCLDPATDNEESFAHSLLCGDAANRFFSKSLQIVASEDGELGVNLEHAACDAGIWIYLLNQADAAIAGGLPAASGRGEEGKNYRLLAWDAPAALRGRLAAMRVDFGRRAADVEIRCRDFPEYGRDGLKALATSPDAFLQLAFQVAQHGIFGRLRSSYEAVSARGFAQGRTECARGSSGEALAFALALQQGAGRVKLQELFRQAERIHKARLQRCQRGLGIERHFYGLHAMWRLYGGALKMPEPAIFRNPAWKVLKHDALSTSGIGAPYIRYFGFGPVVSDGFGIGYAPEASTTGLAVSAFRSSGFDAGGFADAFVGAARAIASVLAADHPD